MYIDINKIFNKHPFAEYMMKKLRERGFDAVIIGGIVRDALREKLEPDYEFDPQEVDIATSALPAEVKAIFKRHPIVEVGEAFGVLKIISPQGQEYEVATYRVESKYDGRWPGEVKLVRDLEGDVKRRDLTINGLAAREDGRVIDLVGGLQDLQNKVIRTIGDPDERFREDYLRILRAIRCACAIDGRILPEVTQAIIRNKAGLELISKERIRDELFRILQTNRSAKGFKMLDEHGILELILPELVECKGVFQPEKYHPEGDVFTHTILALEVADQVAFDTKVKLGILLHDIGKPLAMKKSLGKNAAGHEVIGERIAEELLKNLRLSNEQIKVIKYLVREHLRVGAFAQMNLGKQVSFMKEGENPKANIEDLQARFPLFMQLLRLLIADSEASVHKATGWLPIIQEVVKVLEHIKELDELEKARKLIDGYDILGLGIKEGPQVGRILEAIYEQIFSGKIKSREEALQAAQRLAQGS